MAVMARVVFYSLLVLCGLATSPTFGEGEGEQWRCRVELLRYRESLAALRFSGPNDYWRTDLTSAREGFYSYNTFYRDVLGGQTFEEWARVRQAAGLTTHTLDLMGSAMFTTDEELFTTLTGVRLALTGSETRDSETRKLLTGNLFGSELWRKLNLSMQQREIARFDLIIARPLKGISEYARAAAANGTSESYLSLLHMNMQKLWNRLSPNDGAMFFEVDRTTYSNKEFQRWVATMQKRGFDLIFETNKFEHGAFRARLIRHADSPAVLP